MKKVVAPICVVPWKTIPHCGLLIKNELAHVGRYMPSGRAEGSGTLALFALLYLGITVTKQGHVLPIHSVGGPVNVYLRRQKVIASEAIRFVHLFATA